MNKKGIIALLLTLIMTLTLCACGSDEAPAPVASAGDVSQTDVSSTDWRLSLTADEMAVAQVIVSSTDAFNREDVDAYMATVDPQSEVYTSTRDSATLVFKRYQLNAVIDALSVESIKDGVATVEVTQTTTQYEEGKYAFEPVQVELTHTLTRRGGQWLISSTIVESRRELVDYWGLFVDFAHSDVVSSSDMSGEASGLEGETATPDA